MLRRSYCLLGSLNLDVKIPLSEPWPNLKRSYWIFRLWHLNLLSSSKNVNLFFRTLPIMILKKLELDIAAKELNAKLYHIKIREVRKLWI